MGKKEYSVWVIWLVIGAGMIIYQGFLGGKMVFEQGAGVKPMEPVLQIQEESMPSHSHEKTAEKTSHSHKSDTSFAKPKMHDNHQHDAKKDKKKSESIHIEKKAKAIERNEILNIISNT